MWLKTIQLTNIKGFANSGTIEFAKGINVLAGINNAGKSTLLKSIWLLQGRLRQGYADFLNEFFKSSLRASAASGEIKIQLAEKNGLQLTPRLPDTYVAEDNNITVASKDEMIPNEFIFTGSDVHSSAKSFSVGHRGAPTAFSNAACPDREPNNFIYPYFAHRKPLKYQTMVNYHNANEVEETFENLPSKIDRISNRDFPDHDRFRDYCSKTLNLKISCAQWDNGKQAGLVLQDGRLLPIDSMGEGTVNVLTLLAHLSSATGKLFLIEEIENDLHPSALKALLEIIIERSAFNQFIISTHNNIVVKYLGAIPETKLFSIEMEQDSATKIPISSCKLVSDKPEERVQLLENLGYEPFDFNLWKGYLILEESTAETIIRGFLIPFMRPNLHGRLKTIAASGVTDVEARFSDLLRLFVFIHTSPQYYKRAWVVVDGDGDGEKAISSLKAKFKTWPESHFKSFSEHDFENFYPPSFKRKAGPILKMKNGPERQKKKGQLAKDLLAWAATHPIEAKKQFDKSAKEILDFLSEIEKSLC